MVEESQQPEDEAEEGEVELSPHRVLSLRPRLWPSGKMVLEDGRTALILVADGGFLARFDDGHEARLDRRLRPIPSTAPRPPTVRQVFGNASRPQAALKPSKLRD